MPRFECRYRGDRGIGPSRIRHTPVRLVELEGLRSARTLLRKSITPRFEYLGRSRCPWPSASASSAWRQRQRTASGSKSRGLCRAVITDKIPIPPTEDVSPAVVVEVNGGRLLAHVPWMTEAEAARFVDSRVRVHGVAGAIYNQKNEWVGARLFVPDQAQFEVLEPPPPDPFAIPLRPISDVLRFNLNGSSGHRVRGFRVWSLCGGRARRCMFATKRATLTF